jgi:tRNA (guanine-N7-)-methyltransferase
VTRAHGLRVRQHVNPLKASYLWRAEELVFPDQCEVEVELGCAEAQFLFERAERAPEHRYVGIEIREDLVGLVNQLAEQRRLPVTAVFANANVQLSHLFAPGRVARLFVNFPDPWFKKRHHKRRVMDAALARVITEIVRDGGELLFQSDVWDLALDALEVLEAEPRLTNLAGEWSFWKGPHPYGVRSRREEACAADGAPVWRMLYRVNAAPARSSPAP